MRVQTTLWLAVATLLAAVGAQAQDVRGDQLQIVEGRSGVNPETGFVEIRGEVWNRSGRAVTNARVIVELFDAAGKPIGVTGFLAETKKEAGADPRDSVVTERYFVPAGEVAVFEYVRDPAKLGGAKYASHKLSAAAWAANGTQPNVVIEGFQWKDEGGTYAVSGTIHNTGSVACLSPKAVLGLYSADGKVVRADYQQPQEMFQKPLAPGKSVRFSQTSISGLTGIQVKDAKAWGDCSDPDTAP